MSGSRDRLERLLNLIIYSFTNDLMKYYVTHTIPQVTTDGNGKVLKVDYIWINESSKQEFDKMNNYLTEFILMKERYKSGRKKSSTSGE